MWNLTVFWCFLSVSILALAENQDFEQPEQLEFSSLCTDAKGRIFEHDHPFYEACVKQAAFSNSIPDPEEANDSYRDYSASMKMRVNFRN